MTLTIEFTPHEEAWVSSQAARQGVPPADIIHGLLAAQLADTPAHAEPTAPAPVIDAKTAAAIALLDSWIEEGTSADAETRRQAEQELEEFKRALNANRAATGERLVFP